MKIKFIKYCDVKIGNQLVMFSVNSVDEIDDDIAQNLIDTCAAIPVGESTCSENGQVVSRETKMVELLRRRGRPRKEV